MSFPVFTALVVALAAIDGALGYALVTGTVFCDQCKDGQLTLFDYPLYGIKVTMACPGSDGQSTVSREETTNWFGNYAMRFDGTPNLDGCYAQVSGNGNGCGAAAGPARSVKLMFNFFNMEMYSVDPLLAQPADPMPFCLRSAAPVRPPTISLPPPSPPLPRLPPMPPVPFLDASVCPYEKWMMAEYRCYWRVVMPETKVAVAFGLIAGNRYGSDMSLAQGLTGSGDPYRTLLREGTAALLNSYNSVRFAYNPIEVVQRMNWALLGSTQQVLHTALSFLRANSGAGSNATCGFTPCK